MGTAWDILSYFWVWDVPALPAPQVAGDTSPVTLGPKAAIWDRFFHPALASFWQSVFSECPGLCWEFGESTASREGPVLRAFKLCRLHLGF